MTGIHKQSILFPLIRKLEYDETNDLFVRLGAIRGSTEDYTIGVFLHDNGIYSVVTEKKPEIIISKYKIDIWGGNYDGLRRLEEEIKEGLSSIAEARRYRSPISISSSSVLSPESKVIDAMELELFNNVRDRVRRKLEAEWWKGKITINDRGLNFPKRKTQQHKKLETYF